MTLSNHGNAVTSLDTIKKGMTETLILVRCCDHNTTATKRPILETWSWQEGIRFIEELESREGAQPESSILGDGWAKRAHGVRERRSRAEGYML